MKTRIIQFILLTISGILFSCGVNRQTLKDPTNSTEKQVASTTMQKEGNPSLFETEWQLVEIQGKPVNRGQMNKSPYLQLKTTDHRVYGNGSCNTFSGNYTLGNENQLHFSPMISTRMACPHLDVENALFQLLEKTSRYTISRDSLTFLSRTGEILARFIPGD